MIGRNDLVADDSGAIKARDSGDREEIECGLVLRSIGYKGVPLHGIHFDHGRATINNVGGRVLDSESGEQVPGQYAVGWIKRGPSGVIGTNKKDAHETVNHLFEDLDAGHMPEAASSAQEIVELIAERQPHAVSFAGWEAIDRAETERGEPHGRPRVKFHRIDEMVEVSRAHTAA